MITRRIFNSLLLGASTLAYTGVLARPAAAQNTQLLKVAVDSLWQTMSPVTGFATSSARIYCNFYERFTVVDYLADPNGSVVVNQLAESFERDGAVWTVKMREGVLFHNGEEMTAEDAAFTLSDERYRADDAYEPRGATFTEGFIRVEAIDRYTLEIETQSPDIHVPAKLSSVGGIIVPKAYYLEKGVDAFGQEPIGTGPYRVTTFRSGEIMVLEAFDQYWGDAAPVSRLEWHVVPEFAARMAGVVSGEYHVMVGIPTDQEAQLASYDGVNVISVPFSSYAAVAFNTLPDPVDNPLVDARLRYAMVQAVDMDLIVQALFGDTTFHPAVPFNFPEYGEFYEPDLQSNLPYDPDAARALVAQTDYDGQPLIWHITRSFYPNYETAAEIMVAQWAEVGINVEMRVLDNFSMVYQRPFHLMNFGNATSFIPGDPYQPLWMDWNPEANRSRADWKTWAPSADYIAAGARFNSALTFEERFTAFKDLSAAWQEVTPALFMWRQVGSFAVRDGVTWHPAGSEMRMFGGYLSLA
ncbi:ABC transporter substrate-binding protein [Ketogulonicigenium vulgare]|uniref:Extracellular solute-binding protein family 5 n=1 Tax=Ketogulonicigenium vulgare (strain WSH-001) TaxID=759362 RepID=F9YAV9_KETVW|nr:ABC transporter substrate-binding protein [Ketogulonicigenium vulgare]ADO43984.1 extracellular solute-binding protein family 5 [Ketogulonicigenium vulgare Y25]AEM42511.1 Extracellular solute-binding protein family 5 [Ketogulonicigenium vulgare WSH-001]ALJ82550.1 ABC transporter substrate-binding protein [Ketogulonicigenium vulgare]ANW35322.1 ABC transporter substrate-binding protein [Ketogulonicigenium vulgare]AOZ53216.1 extracellular solute-binding protein family 5 [Ketogulonicigenium vulg